MDQKELEKRLALHKKWLDEEGGTRLDLKGANLRFARLRFADLRYANLQNTVLMNANLNYALTTGAIGLTVICAQVNTSEQNRLISYYPSLDVVTAGCWQSSMAEFKQRVEKVYGENGDDKDRAFLYARYQRVIAFLEQEAAADKEKDDCATSRQGDLD